MSLASLFGRGDAPSRDTGPEGERILPTDVLLECDCGAQRPLEGLRPLYTFARRGDAFVQVQSGVTASCHACDSLWDMTARGRFLVRRGGPQREGTAPDTERSTPNPPAHLRTPLERPRV